MQGIINQTVETFNQVFSSQIPEFWQPLVILAFYAIILALYVIFIWKFYKFLAKRDIINIDLSKFNRSEHPVLSKTFASTFFLIEYLIILPILVFFWFSILALFLLFLSKTQSVSHILLISAAIVSATRMASYYSGTPAKELAKIFPLSILSVFLLDPNFFSIEKLIGRFSSIPSFFNHILVYLIFILALEIVLRSVFIFVDFISSEEEREVEEVTG